jgi:hypothetical protein
MKKLAEAKKILAELEARLSKVAEESESKFVKFHPLLKCDMTKDCNGIVTHVDSSGFIYCAKHAEIRKRSKSCRKLKPSEIKKLEANAMKMEADKTSA